MEIEEFFKIIYGLWSLILGNLFLVWLTKILINGVF